MNEIYKTIIENYKLLIPDELMDYFTDEKYILSNGTGNGAIHLYKEENWALVEGKLKSLPRENSNARDLKRYFLGSAADTEMENNTIFIPEYFVNRLCNYKDVQTIDVQLYFSNKSGYPLVIEAQEGWTYSQGRK